MIVAGVCYRTVEAREYLGGIPGHEPRKIFGEDFHAVVMDKLNGGAEAEKERVKKLAMVFLIGGAGNGKRETGNGNASRILMGVEVAG